MEPIELLLRRRSVPAKNLTEPGPSDAVLKRILQAAIRVPDHGRINPWRIQVVHKAAQRRLGDLCGAIFAEENPDANEKQIAFEIHKPQRAPLLLVVSTRIDREHRIPELEQMLSTGAVCQNILHATHALGFAGNWLTGWVAFHPRIKAALGVPDDQHIAGLIYLGTPAETPEERPRPDFDEVISDWEGPVTA